MMADVLVEVENMSRLSRPSLAQVKAIIEFMQKHPDLAHRRLRYGISQEKFRKLWIELSNIANSIEGAIKSTKGWIKFWSDKRRSIMIKQKQIYEGKTQDALSSLEQKILDLCFNNKSCQHRKRKSVKREPYNDDDDDSMDSVFSKDDNEFEFSPRDKTLMVTETDERQMNIMEKLVEIMNQQASAMSQMAQACLNNSKSMEHLAEAAQIQALAVDRMANTFESISTSVQDTRNAIMSIDYTMKRCYPTTTTHRQNANLFS